jgi:hypothetical protein
VNFFTPDVALVEGTIWSADDLHEAGRVWQELRDRYAPGWVANEESVLGRLLTTQAQPATCEAIALAQSFFVVWGALTRKSVPVFASKVRDVFYERSTKQFDERITEIAFAEVLARRASPIAFEPYVPENVTGDPPSSADYAIFLPDGAVAIDVTVLHVDHFEAWSRAVRQLADGLRLRVDREGKFVALELGMPLEFDRRTAQGLLSRQTLSAVLAQEQGELKVPVGPNGEAILRWSPLAVLTPPDDLSALPPNAFAAVRAPEGGVGSGSAFSCRPIGTPNQFEEFAYQSLRRTLQRKAKQFASVSEPALVAVKSAHHWVPPDGLLDLVNRRVWPNQQFSWLAGVCVFVPRTNFHPTDRAEGHQLFTTFNENAKVKATSAAETLFGGEKKFHLRDGTFEEQ